MVYDCVSGNPLFDFGPVAFLSMSAEETESNLGTLMKVYYDRYKDTSISLGLREEDLLWQSFEDFESETSVL